MVIERQEKIVKIKYVFNFNCIRHKWCKINKKKVNSLVQNTHSFARVQTVYFLLRRKSSLLIFHFKSKYCLVVQHRKYGTETKGDNYINARPYYLSFPGRISFFRKVASVEFVLYRMIFGLK